MTHQLVTIEKATAERLREVLEILSQAELPHEGVEEHLSSFLVARSGGGEIVGCVGLERHGEIGLLRSAAMIPQYQGQRIGADLIRELLKRTRGEGVAEVALLTTTAKRRPVNETVRPRPARTVSDRERVRCPEGQRNHRL